MVAANQARSWRSSCTADRVHAAPRQIRAVHRELGAIADHDR